MFSLKRNMVAFALKSFNSRAANIICHNQRSLSGINPTPNKESDKDLLFEHIKSKILLTGPITVATYMKEILTNPSHGYYINKDVFGATGDFITSPEITQMFGELVTLWLTHEMNKINAPTNKIDIVELGPGRGTMMRDVLRTFHKLKLTSQIDSVYLVEVSNELSKIQGTSLCVPESIERNENMLVSRKRKVSQILDTASVNDNKDNSNKENVTSDSKESKNETLEAEEQDLCYQSGTTKNGTKIKWYTSIFDVPQKNFTLFLAHEFFDALPVHKFVKTENGWREILIDFSANTNELCYVKSKNATPACLFINENETRDHVEISLQTGVIVKNIATRLEENGGIGLIIDYGHNGEGKDTFRAYCNHKQTDPLKNIGHSDLTADVDFKYIRDSVKDKVITFGPINQREFLKQMHIDIRLNALVGVCSNDHEVKILQSAVDIKNEEGAQEWGLVELQGDLESRTDSRMENKFVGDLHIQKNGTPVLIIGHHILHGKVQKLETPLAVMRKIHNNADSNGSDLTRSNDSSNAITTDQNGPRSNTVEYEILVIITRKMIFKTRPKPIVVAQDTKV